MTLPVMSVANDIFPHPQGGSGGRVKTLPYRCFETRAGSLGGPPAQDFPKLISVLSPFPVLTFAGHHTIIIFAREFSFEEG